MRTIKYILIICLLSVSASFAADTSTWHSLSAGAGTGESENYSVITDLIGSGVVVGGSAQSDDTRIGFLAGLIDFGGGDVTDPVIADFKINNREVLTKVKDGDYIDADSTITATVTDDAGINQSDSEVGADSDTVAFNSGAGIYDANSGALNYSFSGSPLADGDHTIKITAVDTTGNSTSSAVTLKVSSVLEAKDALSYPNPWNPTQGNLQVGYTLTKSTDQPVTIIIVNAYKQLVYKRVIPVGQEGTLAGYNIITWNGMNVFGERVSPQILFLKAISGNDQLIKRIKIAVLI
ncbi:MAG: hypothetical protein U9R38_07085 [Candidatus Margulisiibacteriota bacterium]|nr:hypothetical protein [Candidatus Margulisiibacteriota bacterium]